LADHLARLDRSCHELYRAPLPAHIGDRVAAAVAGTTGRFAIRVRAMPDLAVSVTARPAAHRPASSAARSVLRPGGLWRHKWADRVWADDAERDGRAPLFVGADGAVLETTRGNVFLLRADGTLVTPPLRDDLLPGVTRRALLDVARDAGRDVELRSFRLDEMVRHAAFWTSSLSLAVPIHALDGTPLPAANTEISALASSLVSTGNSPVR
jgi:para-aminobenzoate synthetase/4-amino-4-deoxychorismate lyase